MLSGAATDAAAHGPAVLVVGAGPTGLALALSLAKAGIAIRVVDSSSSPATTSRAIGIQSRTLELLDLFGLADAFVSLGLQARAGNVYAGQRRLVHLNLGALENRFPYILLLEQTETERLMTEALAQLGVSVEWGVTLLSFEQDEKGVSVQLSDKSGLRQTAGFSYMVGCDGAHSSTRHHLGLGFAGKTLHQSFMLADLDVHWGLRDDEFHIFTSPEGLMAIFPMRRGHRLIAEISQPPEDSREGAMLPQLEKIAARRSATAMAFSDLRWSSFFRVNSRLATRLRCGRVFLAGDAAHIHSPAGAQGMNTGIQDAVNLGWKLSFVLRGGASTALLATYESERYPVEQRVLRNTEILTRFVALRAPILRFARDRIAPRITRTNLVQRIARETISEIGVSYHHACRNPRRIDPIGLAAGDRVPDLAIEIEDDGSSRRLYSVLDATRFTLLVLTRKRVASFEAEVGVSPQDKLARLLRARFAPRDGSKNRDDWFYLIRPDGYLAVQGPLSHIEEATAWLASLRSEEPIAN